ncbi:MAG: hypothetical protein FWC57_02700 [Endomicrobia bacterium]|nr:hypothetical protein [Endomicrobiia bacterium]
MKNKLFCLFLALVLFSTASYAARPRKKADADMSSAQAALAQTDSSTQQYGGSNSSSLGRARDLYLSGKIDKSELILNQILLANPDYTDALELKNKILIVKDKFYVFKRDTAEDYMTESERSLRDGNFYEGLLYYKRAVDLMPEMYDAQRYNNIIGELNAQSLKYRGSDRKDFLQSVESFQSGDFRKAKSILDSLSDKYVHLNDYRGLMTYFVGEYDNNARVEEYYNEALGDFKKGRYESARIALDYAIAMNRKNPAVALLSEQINLELQ